MCIDSVALSHLCPWMWLAWFPCLWIFMNCSPGPCSCSAEAPDAALSSALQGLLSGLNKCRGSWQAMIIAGAPSGVRNSQQVQLRAELKLGRIKPCRPPCPCTAMKPGGWQPGEISWDEVALNKSLRLTTDMMRSYSWVMSVLEIVGILSPAVWIVYPSLTPTQVCDVLCRLLAWAWKVHCSDMPNFESKGVEALCCAEVHHFSLKVCKQMSRNVEYIYIYIYHTFSAIFRYKCQSFWTGL